MNRYSVTNKETKLNNQALVEAQALVTTLLTYTEIVSQSAATLAQLKNAIVLMSDYAGFRLVFDPGTDPELVDYLSITIPKVVGGMALGGLLGAFFGALANAPKQGATVGAGIGAVVGLAQGIDAVNQGWRVRAQYQLDGSLYIRQF